MFDTITIILALGAVGLAIVLARQAGISMLTLLFVVLPFPVSIMGEGSAGNISPADVVATVAAIGLFQRRKLIFGGAGQAILLLLIVATFSSVFTSTQAELAFGIGRMGLLTLVPMLLLANAKQPMIELQRGLIAYCLSVSVLSGFSLYAFLAHGIDASMQTLDINKNGQGSIFGAGVVIAFAALMTRFFRQKNKIALTAFCLSASAVGLLLCLSRGGWVGTLIGVIIVMVCTKRTWPAVAAAVIFVPVIAAVWSNLPEDRKEYATDVSPDAYVLKTRFNSMEQVLDIFRSNPIFGVGVGLERVVEPHNIVVITLGEMGIVGLCAFCIMVGAGIVAVIGAMRRAPPDSREHAVMIAGLAVFAVYHIQTLIDVYWRRGVGALSWAGVGAAVGYLFAVKTRRMVKKQIVRSGRLKPSPTPTPAIRLHARS